MNMSFIIMEGNCGEIDADDSKCCGYNIILFYSYWYKHEADLSIYGQVISSGKTV